MNTPPQFVHCLLRWHGREEGPLAWDEIERRLANNEIGMLHEIQYEGAWIPLRSFLEIRAAQQAAERARREAEERHAREESERLAREREAQQRADLLAEEKRKNDLLQAAVQSQQEPVSNAGRSGLQTVGWLLLLGGAGIAFYFFVFFDPSVSTGLGSRVVNLGLMNDRQSGILVALGMTVVGVLLVIFGKR